MKTHSWKRASYLVALPVSRAWPSSPRSYSTEEHAWVDPGIVLLRDHLPTAMTSEPLAAWQLREEHMNATERGAPTADIIKRSKASPGLWSLERWGWWTSLWSALHADG